MARFGVRLENDPTLSPQDYQVLASQAERNGFDAVWVPEGGGRDSLTSLATIAMKTERVMLGTGILPIFARTPTNTAMGAAGMAAVSNGRFMLGLGVGHRPTVESRDGVVFRQPMTRMRETIQIVKGLLSGAEVNFPGKHFKVTGASMGAATPKTKVPIYIAALGPQMLEMAGELCDGVLMNWTAVDYLAEAVGHIKRGTEKAGRDPKEIDIAGYVRVAVGDDVSASRDSLRRQVARYASNPFYCNFFKETGFDKEMSAAAAALAEGNLDKAAESITEEMQDQVAIVGTVAECRAALEKRRAAGLQLPVIAPFAVGDNMTSHMHVINALAPNA
ncbi:MAG: LLM class flavin-dependent oxidoreductase [Chloroflexi bacterium]|nr:LLM class flavin-dependent oxidoreductase [Chloroflexota bacterium]MDA1271656.1 LLM class flavin-dependent oxidoreductase [Chloroflexota bacterium]